MREHVRKQLHEKLSACTVERVSPLGSPDFAFGRARAEGVGVPGDEGPPTKAHEALGDFVSFLISVFFWLWSKRNVSSWHDGE